MAEIDLDFEGANKQDSNLDNTDDSKLKTIQKQITITITRL